MHLNNTVLPEPLRPIIPCIFPISKLTFKLFNATVSLNALQASLTSTILSHYQLYCSFFTILSLHKSHYSMPSAVFMSFLAKNITESILSVIDTPIRNATAYGIDGESPVLCQSRYCRLLQLSGEK